MAHDPDYPPHYPPVDLGRFFSAQASEEYPEHTPETRVPDASALHAGWVARLLSLWGGFDMNCMWKG